MPKQQPLGVSKNGVKVTYDAVNSHAATHLEDTPQLKSLVREVVESMELNGQEIKTHVDMGRIVGTCDVVDVNETDDIIYGVRKNRWDDGLVPFTKTREAEPCRHVAIQLVPQEDGTYELSSAWIGTFDEDDDEPFPQSPNATKRSAEYWNCHAFVWGAKKFCPELKRQSVRGRNQLSR